MPEIVMPRLSDSMEEGTILRWLVEEGAEVGRGQEIAEIETDKATMTYESDAAGVIRFVASEGDTLPIGEVIAVVGDEAEAPPRNGAGEEAQPADEDQSAEEEPAEEEPAEEEPPDGRHAGERAAAEAPRPRAQPSAEDGRVKASPVARRIARERGVDLEALSGSGPGGRIVKADVEAAAGGEAPAREETRAPAPAAAEAPAAEAGPRGTAKGDVAVQELTRTQQTIARRMAESKATVPDFSVTTEVAMDRCVEARAQLKELAGDERPVPSYNDMVVRACALALRDHPRVNGGYRDGRFELYSRINVGVAVAREDALIVPTVFDADRKSLGQIAQETRALAGRVRDGEIRPPELAGGTFTVSNLGMFGVTEFTAVINPPQAAILTVGALREVPAVEDGAVVPRHRMTMTLVCDHRILYGADGARFLARVRELLEHPLAMAV